MGKIAGKLLSVLIVLGLLLGVMTSAVQAEEAETAPDLYNFVISPNSDLVPDYYEFYTKVAVGNSPHYVCPVNIEKEDCTYLFNIVNMDLLIEDEAQAPEGGYATVNGYCSDLVTPVVHGSSYRRLNLEDGYFCHEGETPDYTPARKVRSVMKNTFPKVEDPEEMTAKVNAWLLETDGEEAVLVENLTGAEWVAASQCAVWHYTNGAEYPQTGPYCRTEDFDSWGDFFCNYYYYPMMMYLDHPINIREKQSETTAPNMNAVYRYLINLPGTEPVDVAINDSALEVVSTVYTGDEIVFLVALDGTVNEDDNLVLHAEFGGVTQDIPLTADLSLNARGVNLYPVAFSALTRAAEQEVRLWLDGTQSVEDACYLEAKPTEMNSGRKASQSMVINSTGAAPVHCNATYSVPQSRSLSITKVDALSGQPLSGVAFDLYMELDGQEVKLDTCLTGEDGTVSVEVAEDATRYYFKEAAALPGYELSGDSFTEGQVPNHRSVGTLSVTKALLNASEAQAHEVFPFSLTLDLSTAAIAENGFDWLAEDLTETVTATKELSWEVTEDGKLTTTFTLVADETITVEGIPLGTAYTLEETLSEEQRQLYSVSSVITAGEEDPVTATGTTASGTLAQENAVIYTNEVIEDTTEPSEPEGTEPSEPEETEPEETEPTEPEETEPEGTEPTEPETTAPTAPETATPDTPVPDGSQRPDTPVTGDISLAAPMLLVVLSSLTVALLLACKRRFLR